MSYQFNTTTSSTTSFSDETHLESFVESIAVLPNELKRVLEHLRDLDDASGRAMEAWRERQDDCLAGVEGTLLAHFRGEAAEAADAREVGAEDADASATGQGTRGRKRKHEEKGRDKQDQEGEDSSPSPPSAEEVSEYLRKRGPPTDEEIRTILRTNNPQYESQREEITKMYRELQQFSSEKRSTAQQLKAMVDMAVGRLNRDLAKFESELGIDSTAVVDVHHGGAAGHRPSHAVVGGAMAGHGAPQPAASLSAAAAASNAGHGYRRSSSSNSAGAPPAASAMPQPFPSMRGAVPPPPRAVTSTTLAAIQVKANSPDWILAKIIAHNKSSKTYTLSDEDLHTNQIYTIPERQVVPLKGTEKNKWVRGDIVYAVYPDTTSFYHATVSTPPYNGFVMVQFKDDWDANGVTHEKAVLLQHVMKVPPGGK